MKGTLGSCYSSEIAAVTLDSRDGKIKKDRVTGKAVRIEFDFPKGSKHKHYP